MFSNNKKGGVSTRRSEKMVDEKPLTEKQRRLMMEERKREMSSKVDDLSDLFNRSLKVNKPNTVSNRLSVLNIARRPKDIYPSTYNKARENKFKLRYAKKVSDILNSKKKSTNKKGLKLTLNKKKKINSKIPESAIKNMKIFKQNRELNTIMESMKKMTVPSRKY